MPARRDSRATRRRILDAAADELIENGFADFGINALARRAGVDKVLIYRYFEGLDGVLDGLVERIAAPPEGEGAEAPGVYGEVFANVLTRYAAALRDDQLARRLLAWELVGTDEIVRRLGAARARAARAWFARARVRGGTSDPDAEAVNALLIAGVHHLALREMSAGEFAGLDLRETAVWARIDAAIRRAATAIHGSRGV